MRTVIAVLACLFLLAACGGHEEEIAAKRAELQSLKPQLKALNLEYTTKAKEWQKVKNAFIPANQVLKHALSSGDKDAIAAAQAAFDQAQSENEEVSRQEAALKRSIRQLEDKIRKIETDIQALGGGKPER